MRFTDDNDTMEAKIRSTELMTRISIMTVENSNTVVMGLGEHTYDYDFNDLEP